MDVFTYMHGTHGSGHDTEFSSAEGSTIVWGCQEGIPSHVVASALFRRRLPNQGGIKHIEVKPEVQSVLDYLEAAA